MNKIINKYGVNLASIRTGDILTIQVKARETNAQINRMADCVYSGGGIARVAVKMGMGMHTLNGDDVVEIAERPIKAGAKYKAADGGIYVAEVVFADEETIFYYYTANKNAMKIPTSSTPKSFKTIYDTSCPLG